MLFLFLFFLQIPDTDIECRWDWRSIRCEPACQCHLDLKVGDYHLGRSCRFRPPHDDDDIDDSNNNNNTNNNTCIDIHPAMFLRETAPIPKRIISLSTQTLDIIKLESQQALQTVRREFNVQLGKLQKHVCRDIWELRKEAMQQQQQQQQGKDGGIFYLPPPPPPPPRRRQVPPTRHSIAEKLLCGGQEKMDHNFNVERDDRDNEQGLQDFMAAQQRKTTADTLLVAG